MGKILIFSAPSGSGKSTIVGRLMETGMPLGFSISATSRAPRGQEQDGVEYYSLSMNSVVALPTMNSLNMKKFTKVVSMVLCEANSIGFGAKVRQSSLMWMS